MSDAHDQLRALLQRYARAADARDVDTLASLFHPEAEIAGTRGVQTLPEWLDGMRAPRVFAKSMHFMGDPLIELTDGEREAGVDAYANLDTYAVVYQLSDPATGNNDLTLGIRYLDVAVRHASTWVLKRRSATTLWMR